MTNPKESAQELEREKLNLETGRIGWQELQRHFARGAVIVIDKRLDLVKVAQSFSRDDTAQVQEWIGNGLVVRAHDDHAKRWNEGSYQFWSIVVAPWVFVQEIVLQ